MKSKSETEDKLLIEISQLKAKLAEIENSETKNQTDHPFKKSQYFFAKAQEIGKIGSWELDLVKDELTCTDQNYINFGISVATPLTHSLFLSCVHPEDRDYVNTEWMEALKGKPYDIEYRILINGDIRWLREKAEVNHDANGKPISAIGFSQDVTENKLAENALKESEKKYRNLINLAQEGIWLIDKNNITSFVNSSMAKMLGYSMEEMIGKSLFDFMDEKGVQIANENLERRKAGLQEKHEFEFVCKNGNRIYCTLVTAPILDKTGNYNGAIAGIIDITERKKAELELIKERNKAQQYLEIAEIILLSIDSDGIVQLINPKGCEVLGYSKDEIIGKNWCDNFIPERMREVVKKVAAKVYSGELESVKYYENEILTKTGKEKIIAWNNSVLRDDKGNILGTLSSGEDITERKNAELELKKHRLHLEELVKERTKDLEDKNTELLRINDLFVNREYRIKELREEIKRLKNNS